MTLSVKKNPPLLLALLLLSLSLKALSASDCGKVLKDERLIELNEDKSGYGKLSPRGLEVFKQGREAIRKRARLFNNEFQSLETVHHAGLLARLFQGHLFLYGPPGGAKSAFVEWMMAGEAGPNFRIQMHQMITEQALIGGQIIEEAKRGRFKVNTGGSIVDSPVSLIDEIEKGNPAALAVLLRLLNEREVIPDGQVVKAKLETLFSTSNANLPEFFDLFVENGQGPTGPALLNRFHFKAFVYNWLSSIDQAILDRRKQKIRRLNALAQDYPEVLKDEVFLKPEEIDWPSLRRIANSIFEPGPLFMVSLLELVNEMRAKTNEEIKNSKERHEHNHLDEPFVYFPSADYTERLRQQIPEIIFMSAFIDFMLSPLSNDVNLNTLIQQGPIELGPLSLWRAFTVLTSIGPGKTQLIYKPEDDQKIDLDFQFSIETSNTRDAREELLIKNLKEEQERFRRSYLGILENIQENIEIHSRHALKDRDSQEDLPINLDDPFELLLLRHQ